MFVYMTVPYGYCHCGCGEKTPLASRSFPDRGWVKGEPIRFVNRHGRRLTTPEYAVEDRGYRTPCWIWRRAKYKLGYGAAWDREKRKQVQAHRLYFERANGYLPDCDLDHLCRNPSCVNPDHLEPVSHAENCRRGSKSKLTPEQVAEIRSSDEPTRSIARRLEVHHSSVYLIRSGVNWAD